MSRRAALPPESSPGPTVPADRRRDTLARLGHEVVACRRCPRLVAYRELVARVKRRQFREEAYWGRPLPGFGDPEARLLVVGLAPAAHGGNRTGRMFTGDASGLWLLRAMHGAGFANHPWSRARDDGVRLRDAYITAAVRCAPPGNRPTVDEIARCRPFLVRERVLLRRVRVVVGLGRIAFTAALGTERLCGAVLPRPLPRFAHGAEARLGDVVLLASYHPSQQNTQTGRLTETMLAAVFRRAAVLVRG